MYIKDKNNLYLTGDLHLFHDDIIEICGRPFKNMKYMSRGIVNRFKEVLNKDSILIIVGDITMKGNEAIIDLKRFFNKIPGTKHLVLGNHDKLKPFDYIEYIGFTSVSTSIELEECVIIHDPAISVINRNKCFLCAHVHTLFDSFKNVVNVGVDVRNFYPISFNDAMNIYKNNNLIS